MHLCNWVRLMQMTMDLLYVFLWMSTYRFKYCLSTSWIHSCSICYINGKYFKIICHSIDNQCNKRKSPILFRKYKQSTRSIYILQPTPHWCPYVCMCVCVCDDFVIVIDCRSNHRPRFADCIKFHKNNLINGFSAIRFVVTSFSLILCIR